MVMQIEVMNADLPARPTHHMGLTTNWLQSIYIIYNDDNIFFILFSFHQILSKSEQGNDLFILLYNYDLKLTMNS